jgi:2'-5' RNA ligase
MSDTNLETYDPTWPYNFKWGVTPDNQVTVWRAKGGIDGRPGHRTQLEKFWGRKPSVRNGDTLGIATYIPAELKFDGTIVAPPLIKVQALYGMPVPPSLITYFQEHFPGTQVVQANIVTSKLSKLANDDWDFLDMLTTMFENQDIYTGKTVKWIYNENEVPPVIIWETQGADGSPIHSQKVREVWGRPLQHGSNDYCGYGDIFQNSIRMGSYLRLPAKAFQQVKSELAKRYPDLEINTDNVLTETEEPSFTDPNNVSIISKAAGWAHRVFSKTTSRIDVKAPRSHSETTKYNMHGSTWVESEWVKESAADLEGCMIALYLPEEVTAKLKQPDGEPEEQMHITLVYFQDKQEDRDDWHEIERITKQFANQKPPLEGSINGFGVFYNEEDVLWAAPSIQGLANLRAELVEACEDAGFAVSNNYDWLPHVTLKYGWKGELPKLEKPIEFKIDSLSFAMGDKAKHFKFKGSLEKEADWESYWEGFPSIVDDKETGTENQSQRIPWIVTKEGQLLVGKPGTHHIDMFVSSGSMDFDQIWNISSTFQDWMLDNVRSMGVAYGNKVLMYDLGAALPQDKQLMQEWLDKNPTY